MLIVRKMLLESSLTIWKWTETSKTSVKAELKFIVDYAGFVYMWKIALIIFAQPFLRIFFFKIIPPHPQKLNGRSLISTDDKRAGSSVLPLSCVSSESCETHAFRSLYWGPSSGSLIQLLALIPSHYPVPGSISIQVPAMAKFLSMGTYHYSGHLFSTACFCLSARTKRWYINLSTKNTNHYEVWDNWTTELIHSLSVLYLTSTSFRNQGDSDILTSVWETRAFNRNMCIILCTVQSVPFCIPVILPVSKTGFFIRLR